MNESEMNEPGLDGPGLNETGPDSGMKVTVQRSGGFAGMTRSWTVELAELFDDWREAIFACPWDEAEDLSRNDPDRYMYVIQAGDRTVELPEQAVKGPWKELVEKTQEAADSGKR